MCENRLDGSSNWSHVSPNTTGGFFHDQKRGKVIADARGWNKDAAKYNQARGKLIADLKSA